MAILWLQLIANLVLNIAYLVVWHCLLGITYTIITKRRLFASVSIPTNTPESFYISYSFFGVLTSK